MSLTAAHSDNLVRWTPAHAAGHYESHFIKVNLPQEQLAIWWKFTILQPLPGLGPARFEVWAVAFDAADPHKTCAAKESFGAASAAIARDRLHCDYGGNILEHNASCGHLSGEHDISWDIRWTAPETGFRHFPSPEMYTAPLPKAKILTPAPSAPFFGTVTVDGRTVSLDGQLGMQGHNWGRQHANSWVWVHANLFREAQGAVFEAVSSKIQIGPIATPQLTILHFDDGQGAPLTVNGWTEMIRTTSDQKGLRWRFRGSHGDRALEGLFYASAERFVGLRYEDPDGRITNCLNSKIADGDLRLLRREGKIWRLERSLSIRAAAALEIGLKDETHGVQILA